MGIWALHVFRSAIKRLESPKAFYKYHIIIITQGLPFKFRQHVNSLSSSTPRHKYAFSMTSKYVDIVAGVVLGIGVEGGWVGVGGRRHCLFPDTRQYDVSMTTRCSKVIIAV